MAIIYDENSSGRYQSKIPYDRLPATTYYLTHYANWKYLNFLSTHPDTGWQEKQQARHEMTIADKKMNYWRRHPNWSQPKFEEGKRRIDQQWQQTPTDVKNATARSLQVDMPLGTAPASNAGRHAKSTPQRA